MNTTWHLLSIKKITVLSLILLISFTLMWCGSKNTEETTEKNDTVENTQEANEPKVQEPSQKPTTDPDATVESWNVVKINYIGSSEETGVFDTSLEEVAKESNNHNPARTYQPLEFTVWQGMMIPGMEKWVLWMKVWEEKTLVIAASEAYWEARPELLQDLPKENFEKEGINPVVGETYNFGIARWKVLEIWDETIKLDFNHELAWKELTFVVTLVELLK